MNITINNNMILTHKNIQGVDVWMRKNLIISVCIRKYPDGHTICEVFNGDMIGENVIIHMTGSIGDIISRLGKIFNDITNPYQSLADH